MHTSIRLRETEVQDTHEGSHGVTKIDRSEDSLSEILPLVPQALYNHDNGLEEPFCINNTRVEVLKAIREWADAFDEKSVLWLHGAAGSGKSTIARTISREFDQQKRLGASFFFDRGGGDASHAGQFSSTLAVQLAQKQPTLGRYIRDAVGEFPSVTREKLSTQWDYLIRRPLSKVYGKPLRQSMIVVIDALDVCGSEADIQKIIRLLGEARQSQIIRLRILITCRSENLNRYNLSETTGDGGLDYVLYNIDSLNTEQDIFLFIEHSFRGSKERPSREYIEKLGQKANGSFLWASTACRFISKGRKSVHERLSSILEPLHTNVTDGNLDDIYSKILENLLWDGDNYQEREIKEMLTATLEAITVMCLPLPIEQLSNLLRIPRVDFELVLGYLHSIVEVPEDKDSPVCLLHLSFREYLFDKSRYVSKVGRTEQDAHATLADYCFRTMFDILKTDICNLKHPSSLAKEVDKPLLDKCLTEDTRYACEYWVRHLQLGAIQVQDGHVAHKFLQKHFLHWLEALSLLGKSFLALNILDSLQSLVIRLKSPAILSFISDAKQFIVSNQAMLKEEPLQIYCSALLFARDDCIIRKRFNDQILAWVQMLPKEQVIPAEIFGTYWLSSSIFICSPDSKLIAFLGAEGTIIVCDIVTGTIKHHLKGHSGPVNAVSFSPDSRLLVTASEDKMIKIWNIATGNMQQTLEGHSDSVVSVSFLLNGEAVASGSQDGSARIWDITTGEQKHKLDGFDRLLFSPNGKFAAGPSSVTVQLFDAVTWKLKHTLKSPLEWKFITATAFSLDSKLIAFGSWDNVVRVCDTDTGVSLLALEGLSESPDSIAFSQDGRIAACPRYVPEISVWDVKTGATMLKIKMDPSPAKLAFSPCGRYLETERGFVPIPGYDEEITGTESSAYGIFVQDYRVTYKGKNILWIPEDKNLRAVCGLMRNDVLILGHENGRITFFHLDLARAPVGKS